MDADTSSLIDEHYRQWLPGYVEAARDVQIRLSELFQDAIAREKPGDIYANQGVTTSLDFLRDAAADFPHPLILFLYSNRFDPEVERAVTEASGTTPELPDGLTPAEILRRKVEVFPDLFKAFAMITNSLTAHFVCALMSEDQNPGLPLVWEVPVADERETGYSADALWYVSFQYLCEVARCIVAYGGMSRPFYDELDYIAGRAHLRERLYWLDQEGRLFSPQNEARTWSMAEIGDLLDELAK